MNSNRDGKLKVIPFRLDAGSKDIDAVLLTSNSRSRLDRLAEEGGGNETGRGSREGTATILRLPRRPRPEAPSERDVLRGVRNALDGGLDRAS